MQTSHSSLIHAGRCLFTVLSNFRNVVDVSFILLRNFEERVRNFGGSPVLTLLLPSHNVCKLYYLFCLHSASIIHLTVQMSQMSAATIVLACAY